MFGGIAVVVCGALYRGAFWLTAQLSAYDELGDYLLRLGLSWLFLTFLSFLAFSGVVTSLSTFFLADDLRLLLTAPVPTRRLFHVAVRAGALPIHRTMGRHEADRVGQGAHGPHDRPGVRLHLRFGQHGDRSKGPRD